MKNMRNQVVMPINLEIQMPGDDPVKMLDKICEELDYTKVYSSYYGVQTFPDQREEKD